MSYKVLNRFKDTDETVYETGDIYPKGESEPSQKRMKELSAVHPKYRKRFIEFFESDMEKAEREVKEAKEVAAQKKAEEERLAKLKAAEDKNASKKGAE